VKLSQVCCPSRTASSGRNRHGPSTIRLIVFGFAVAGACPSCTHLRPTQSWPELVRQLAPGRPIAVTDLGGTDVQGKVLDISTSSLTLNVDGAARRFESTDVRQVRRNGDPLWNGLVIGAAIGTLGAMLPDDKCMGQPPVCDRQIPERVAFFALATGIGVGIDALHRDRTILYRSPGHVTLRLVPILRPDRKGLALTLRVLDNPK
jgi:hypothetical protein